MEHWEGHQDIVLCYDTREEMEEVGDSQSNPGDLEILIPFWMARHCRAYLSLILILLLYFYCHDGRLSNEKIPKALESYLSRISK